MGIGHLNRKLRGWGVMLTTHFHIKERLRVHGAKPLLSLHDFIFLKRGNFKIYDLRHTKFTTTFFEISSSEVYAAK
jgi:hypothetical protein